MLSPHRQETFQTKTSSYAMYVGWVMMLVMVMSLLDRKVVVMLAEPLKRDLQLTDTQLGVITGGLFSLVYAVGSFPLARLADRFSRSRIIGGSLIIWSMLTAMGGFATGFLSLALTRVGVALGESGATPAAHALLTNHFPPKSRGFAYSLIMAGGPLGILLGLALGGILNDLFDWRTALFVVGIPGAILGLLVLVTIRDVPRVDRQDAGPSGAFSATVRHIFADAVLRNVLCGASILFVGIGATNALFPAYLMRQYGFSASVVGLGFGLGLGLSGFAGSLLGGWLTDKIGKGRTSRPLHLFGCVLPVIAFLTFARLLTDHYTIILLIVAVETLLLAMYAGPTFTALQARVGDHQRSMATAVMLFGINGIGASLGPVLVGLTSDYVTRSGSSPADALHFALMCVAPAPLIACLFYLRASSLYGREEGGAGLHQLAGAGNG